MKGWGFCFNFFPPFSPVWPAADSFSFSPAFNASWVELWNKHQEVKKQKSLEKTSKEIKKCRNCLLQPPHNCQLPRGRVSLHLWHTVFMPTRTKVYQENLCYRGDRTDQFTLGNCVQMYHLLFFFLILFFLPWIFLLQRRGSRYSASSPCQIYIWKDFKIFRLLS